MFEQITILAPGLLGASVARAARHFGLAKRIVIWARRPETLMELLNQPWCDAVCSTPEEAVKGSSLVVLAPPAEKIVPLAARIAPALMPGAIVTDVGSVKGEICRLCHAAMPKDVHFVGSHPMAGSEKTGWAHGREDLFSKRTCFVTPLEVTDPRATEAVVRFWHELGALVSTVSPDQHDEIVAHISHLPQMVATTLCCMLARKDHGWRNFAGNGLRDTTRIAGSDAAMWIDILTQNRDEILRALHKYEDELHAFTTALANRDFAELRTRLEQGKAYRDDFRP